MKRLVVVLLMLASMLAGAALAYVVFQDPAEPAQDTFDIDKEIRTWYKIMHETEHVGYADVLIAPADSTLFKYQILSTQDAEVPIGDGLDYVHVSSRTNGRLDENFDAVQLSADVVVQGVSFGVEMRLEGGERIILVTPPEGAGPTIRFSGGQAEGVSTDLQLALYRMKQAGDLEKGGNLTFKLLSFDAEEGKVPVPAPKQLTLIVSAQKEERLYMDKKYKVTRVDVEDFPNPVQDLAVKTVWVDGYGRIVEMHTVGKTRMIIAKDSKEAIGNLEVVRQGGRRDPFDKEKVMTKGAVDVTPERTGPGDGKTPEVSDAAKGLEMAKQIVTETRDMHEKGLPTVQLKQKYYEFLAMFLKVRELLLKEARPQDLLVLEALKKEEETYYPGAANKLQEANRVVAEIGRFYRGSDVAKMAEKLKELETFRKSPEFIGQSEEMTQLEEWIKQASKDLEKARVREELRNKTLVVTGTVDHLRQIRAPVRVGLDVLGQRLKLERTQTIVVQETYALINGNAYRVGQVVEGQEVEVIRIDRSGVEVEYKGEVRTVPMQ